MMRMRWGVEGVRKVDVLTEKGGMARGKRRK